MVNAAILLFILLYLSKIQLHIHKRMANIRLIFISFIHFIFILLSSVNIELNGINKSITSNLSAKLLAKMFPFASFPSHSCLLQL